MNRIKKWWRESKTWQHVLLGIGLVVFLYLVAVFSVRVFSRGKILPGVAARGIYLGGLTRSQAEAKLDIATAEYLQAKPTYEVDGKKYELNPSEIGVSYDNKTLVNSLYLIGRSGNLLNDVATQTALPFSDEDVMQINIEGEKYSLAMQKINEQLSKPAQNASFKLVNDALSIEQEKTGRRLDMGLAVLNLTRQLSELRPSLYIPTTSISADITTQNLERQKDKIKKLAGSSIKLSYADKSWEVSKQQILSWFTKNGSYVPKKSSFLESIININQNLADLTINKAAIEAYLQPIAGEINIEAIDAQLTIVGGRASVFKQSRDGKTLDTAKSADAIIASLGGNSQKPIELAVITKKADVSDDNIEKLGIKELLSEGVTFFPGSPSNRLQNVRVGMSKFNGILLKPDQVFSFGEFLGDVGPSQGYAPGLIILGDHEEKAYGGGLCQVSSTAYRAALLAGLPILQRTNHAFAISYYTAPFGVPGVDATIFYPQVDMKFKNDTGHHILIETEMIGTTLKFRFYGTKTKSGNIRGPFFVTGSGDATKPSQTVFYRDVLDMDGRVVNTDAVSTFYKSSLDFPITD
mgnify:CR=1 FL=1